MRGVERAGRGRRSRRGRRAGPARVLEVGGGGEQRDGVDEPRRHLHVERVRERSNVEENEDAKCEDCKIKFNATKI